MVNKNTTGEITHIYHPTITFLFLSSQLHVQLFVQDYLTCFYIK